MRKEQLSLLLIPCLGLAIGNTFADMPTREEAIPLAKTALEEKIGIDPDTYRLAAATASEWPDSSLGCPEKGMAYQPVVTSGYVVSLQADGRTYTVHVAGEQAVICNRAGMSEREVNTARMEQAMQPVNAARTDLATRLNVVPEKIEVVSFERSSWPDVSLGCPMPGETYAETETTGLVIVFEQGGKNYRYHASMDAVRPCDATAESGDSR
jgi:hypothetical protein